MDGIKWVDIGTINTIKEGACMKTTGVVRKIDDLGRIVIPKDIRKNLRIRDGESLEFFVDRETITLKKFSTSASLCDIAQVLSDTIYTTTNKCIFVTDRDKFIAGCGDLKKTFCDFNISSVLEETLFNNENITKQSSFGKDLVTNNHVENVVYKYIVSHILVDGVTIGLVLMLNDTGKNFTVEDEHLIQIIANFLSKYLED